MGYFLQSPKQRYLTIHYPTQFFRRRFIGTEFHSISYGLCNSVPKNRLPVNCSYLINFLWGIRIPHAHLRIKCISKIEKISPKRKFDVLDQSARITNGKIRQKERCNAASLTVQNFSSMVINLRCALEPSHWMIRGENCVTTCFVGPI